MEQDYTLHHRPRSDGRRGGGVGVLFSNRVKLTTRQVSVNPNVASFEYVELVITVSSIMIVFSLLIKLALLRVFNDIASTIGKGNGNLLVLLDLSAPFNTIDHIILFDIFKKYICFDGNAFKLIMSYFSDRTQRV